MRQRSFLFWLATVVVLLIFVLPLVWMYLTSFKTTADIFSTDIKKLLIFSPTLENYHGIFFGEKAFFRELLNTLIVAVASTILVMLVALPAAYSFARYNTGYGHLLFITISTRMFPAVVAAIPFFFAFKALGLLDTHFGLTMLYLYFNMSFAVFLLFGFFREIPVELEQAAMIDGYGRLAILRKIIFPLIKPGAAITTIFCLIFSWNEFLFAFLFTRAEVRTMTIGLSTFWSAVEMAWGPMAGWTALAILPTLTAAWFMQRYIIRGLTFGAVKG
jgi:multiple sugar transport system permease protein